MRAIQRSCTLAFLIAAIIGLACWPGAAIAQPAASTRSPSMAVPATRQAQNVAIITIKGPITEITFKSVERRLKLAQRSGAQAIVIELDTPGGELGATLGICNAIKQSAVTNTVAWINPNAYSAGSVIALSCREIITGDPATMGNALPITFDRMGNLKRLAEHERQKVTAPLLAEVVDSARRNGHDEYLVQGTVALGVELWLVENPQTGERMCINRAEYVELFGSPPAALRPHLFGAPPSSTTAPEPNPESKPISGSSAAESVPDSPQDSSTGSQSVPAESPAPDAPAEADPPRDRPPATPEPMEFKPAAPRLQGMADAVNIVQDRNSLRTQITSADRGKWKLIEYVSDGTGPFTFSADDLLHYRLAAAKIRTDQELKQFFGATHLRRIDQNWSESLVVLLLNGVVRGLLIAVFLIALVIEMFNPGMILPGSIAGIALVLFVLPPFLIGMANWWELAAIGAGILLLAVEVLVLPGFGVPGVLGMMLLFVGLIGTFVGEGGGLFPSSATARSEMLGGLVTVLTSFVSAALGIYFISRNLASIPIFSRLVLKPVSHGDDEAEGVFEAIVPHPSALQAGDKGRAVTPLRPAGKAQFGDRIVDVSSSLGYIDAGTPVRIVTADTFQIFVEPTPPDPANA